MTGATRKPRSPGSGIIPVRSTMMGSVEPLTEKDRTRINDEILARLKKHDEASFAEVIAECRRDPRALDRMLKELKPLRGRGHSRRPTWHDSAVDGIISALQGWAPGEIVAAIALTLAVSTSSARRLYDTARKRRK